MKKMIQLKALAMEMFVHNDLFKVLNVSKKPMVVLYFGKVGWFIQPIKIY